MKTIASLGEFGLINALGLFGPLPGEGWLGPGDDCALVPSPGGQLAVTTDLLIENIHFRRSTTPPRDIGYKSLAASISDLASMGARPLCFTVCLALPGSLDYSFAEEFYAGLSECSSEYSCVLGGGDTSSAPLVFVSVTAFGQVETGKAVLRSGAKPGDDLWVSGFPGESAAGFCCLEKGLSGPDAVKRAISKHLRPVPRVRLGLALSEGSLATSMIDVSDGVFIDAGHIAERSRALLRLDEDKIPLSFDLMEAARILGEDPLALALGGGEDYELLFTGAKENREKILKTGENAGVRVSLIGVVEDFAEEGRVRLADASGTEIPPPLRGFEHFRAE